MGGFIDMAVLAQQLNEEPKSELKAVSRLHTSLLLVTSEVLSAMAVSKALAKHFACTGFPTSI